jgi:hypothetical protein
MMADRQFSQATIDKGVEQIQREAEAAGRPISRADARAQVMAMLYSGGEAELDLPELGV